ncbi:MAG TPA: AMP-binding protein [Amycolatopsis sp.]|nr:AMP-binding protein [Amycolatopsis sp.]
MQAVEVPELKLEERVITEILARRAGETPDAPFVHIGGRTYSYGEIHELSLEIARGLSALGVTRGQRVVMMLGNRIEFLLGWFGTAMLGATIVPINPEWKAETLSYILTDAEPTAMILTAGLVDTVRDVLPQLPTLRTLVLCDAGPVQPRTGVRVVDWPGLPELGKDARLDDGPRFDDPLAILYSSGTTGRPKGIVMPHAHIYSFGIQWSRATNFSGADVLYAPTPLFYMQATVLGVVPTLMAGAQVHIAPRFSATRYWDDVRACGATITHGQFSLVPLLLKQPPSPLDRQHNCTRLFIAKSNAEFEERFGVRIIEIYGSSESNIVCYNPWDRHKPGSAGKAAPNFDVVIVDDQDRVLPQGEIGEIVARPREPYIISGGYYRRPEVTLEAWRNMWFHCGDRGYFDEDGYVYFVDRKKDVIRRKGENISSAEVERQVNTHPDVLESAAVPVPAETAEDEVMVFVVPRPGHTVRPGELIEHLRGILPRFMVPRYVEIIGELPKTGSMKIEKFKLRELGVSDTTWDREAGSYVSA